MKDIFRAAGSGDVEAGGIVREFLEYLTEGAVNLANILRPQVIVLGGGVSASGDMILPAVNRGWKKACMDMRTRRSERSAPVWETRRASWGLRI